MLRRPTLRRASLLAALALILLPAEARAACEQKAARLVSLQGALEIQESGPDEWKAVTPEQEFCSGDKVRTRSESRATLELSNKTYISLNQQTTIVFSGVKARSPSWLDLLKGIIYVRSRTPSSLDIHTRYVNAAIRGTEFLVSADDSQGQISVFEGTVESSNPQGSVIITDGQAAVAKAGEAPTRKLLVAPRDAVQWALHYPPVIDLHSLRQQAADPHVKQAAERYLQGDSLGALAVLAAAEHPDPILRAGLLIGLGRVEAAQPLLDGVNSADPRFGEVLALRSIVALAQGDKAKALDLAQQATSRQPQAPTAWTALSYARQADFQLDQALEAAQQAARLDADNALARAREAELFAALGRREEAKEAAVAAAQLNPRLSRAWAVQGYAELNAMDYAQAEASFRKAIELDNADPLARFGLGLSKIRAGDLEAGTADLELAANLDPDDSITRSYLGKAYFDQKNAKVAATEFSVAKQLDPHDPTPWFYDAIEKQTHNRPVEALEDMEKAIELNGNRAVYRSKQLLDDDLAARSAAVGRIYSDLRFGERALVEGWQSVNAAPQDYSGHRLLADNYAALPNHELARVSELLQSQLLQPININPVQPHLAERNLAILQGLGPAASGFNEFNPLFMRDHFALQTSGLIGSNNTYSDEVAQSGLWENFSYSLGQFHYESEGFRPNNRISQDVYNAFVQGMLTPSLSVQAEYRHKNMTYGDLSYRYDLSNSDALFQNHQETDTFRVGANQAFDANSRLVFSGIYQERHENISTSSYLESLGLPPQLTLSQPLRGYLLETQYVYSGSYLNLSAGGGYTESWAHLNAQPDFASAGYNFDQPKATIRQGNVYGYNYLHPGKNMLLTVGGSLDMLDDERSSQKFNVLNPKIGMTWNATPSATLRAAVFRTVKRSLLTDQTIEPTQVAGFNQLFDDLPGTKAWRYGAGLDYKLTQDVYAGFEFSRRHRSVPGQYVDQSTEQSYYVLFPDRETLYRGYANWAISRSLALSFSYQMEIFDQHVENHPGEPDTRTHIAPISLNYFHPAGWLGSLTVTYVNQTVWNGTSADATGLSVSDSHDEFALLDVGFGYRLPKRYGIIRFDIRNILDQKFNYLGTYYRTFHEERPLFYPQRMFMAQFTLSF